MTKTERAIANLSLFLDLHETDFDTSLVNEAFDLLEELEEEKYNSTVTINIDEGKKITVNCDKNSIQLSFVEDAWLIHANKKNILVV